jgi:hypothetical protein
MKRIASVMAMQARNKLSWFANPAPLRPMRCCAKPRMTGK